MDDLIVNIPYDSWRRWVNWSHKQNMPYVHIGHVWNIRMDSNESKERGSFQTPAAHQIKLYNIEDAILIKLMFG